MRVTIGTELIGLIMVQEKEKQQHQIRKEHQEATEGYINELISHIRTDAMDSYLDIMVSGIIKILRDVLRYQTEKGKREWCTVLLPYIPHDLSESISGRKALVRLNEYCLREGLELKVNIIGWGSDYSQGRYINISIKW